MKYPGEVWDGNAYDPNFFEELADQLDLEGKDKEAKRFRQLSYKWWQAWEIQYLFSLLFDTPMSVARVVTPGVTMNRRALRAMRSRMRRKR